MSNIYIFYTIIIASGIIVFLLVMPILLNFLKMFLKKTRYNSLGESSQIRLVRQLDEAISILSSKKIGAIITIVNKDNIENFRTDGEIINASISASLIIALFSKQSPLHDGAIVIENNKITYASTFYKITNKSIENKYGARHRAAMWMSEQTDSLTIVVSEETGKITFAKNAHFTDVKLKEFQERLTKYLS